MAYYLLADARTGLSNYNLYRAVNWGISLPGGGHMQF